ncbi:2-oxo acid dehydrogenase subunit E2, partial [Actinomadura darangshiensis]
MTRLFRLPDLGEGLTEAEVIEWKVAAGDTVEVDQIVVEVETAKAAVEVPVPFAGTVLNLHAEAGTVLGVGEPLIEVDPVDAAAARYREEEKAGSGNVLIGYGTGHASNSRRRRSGKPPAPKPAVAPRVISPLVRRIAHDNGLDLTTIAPTGPHGVILRRDVEQAIVHPAEAPATEVPTTEGERIPLRGMRRAVADKLSRSRTEIPDATTWVDADATDLLALKDAMRQADLEIGLLALLARICVSGLRRFPELNSSVDTARAEIVRYDHINLGFAAQTDRGLVVPVVRDAHQMTTAELAAELTRLTTEARAGTLPPNALTGGTFTLNNYGVFGVD